MDMEQISFELILNGGNARSRSMEAIYAAKEGDFENAHKKIKEAEEALNKAHSSQTKLIQAEAGGEEFKIDILLIHAQDHLMNAMTLTELAKEIIYLHEVK